MRCLYLALDRLDIQFTAKVISRSVASPTVHADETLEARSRYLTGHPRVLRRYPRQEWTGKKVWGLTDSNWAACLVTRKKTSYLRSQLNTVDFMLGKRGSGVLRSCAVCLSNAGVKTSHVGLVTGCQGRTGNGQLSMQGVVLKRGAGKIRHIHCLALWLQHAVARRQIAITWGAGKDSAPDVGTKAGIAEDTMLRFLGMFGLGKGQGRSKQALNMAGRQVEA